MAKQSIHTPEGVSLEVELAGLGSRAVALLIDFTLAFFIVMTLLSTLEAVISTLAPEFFSDFVIALLGFAMLLIFLLSLFGFAVFMDGATPGKRSLGLRAIGADGRPASAWQHFLRSMALIVDLFLPIGSLMLFFGHRPQRLGDLVAGTIVVREGQEDYLLDPWLKQDWGGREARAIEPTPGAAARFDEADLALLRDIILRRTLAKESARALHEEAAKAYCKRARVEPTRDPRRALKDIFLFLRESRGL